MSDGGVVALVSATGRAGEHASLLAHAVRHLVVAGVVDRIVVVTPESEMDLPADVCVVPDVAAGVAGIGADARVVLVHDPSHAFAPVELIRQVVATVLTDDVSVVPVLPCSDTVKRLDADGFVIDTPDRGGLRVIQTPLGYPAAVIRSGAVVPGVVPVGARTVAT
ncbi:MAG TPA: 2-C-methyl-D-erythritol 4-phosphate cytidylyltransferase [Pseudonocardiaceae bacterium]